MPEGNEEYIMLMVLLKEMKDLEESKEILKAKKKELAEKIKRWLDDMGYEVRITLSVGVVFTSPHIDYI